MSSGANLGDVGDFVTGVATSAIAITALVTAFVALRGIRYQQDERAASARQERGRWLIDLYSKFATDPSSIIVRSQLYRGEDSDLSKALTDIHLGAISRSRRKRDIPASNIDLLVHFDNYLDFLGLVERLIVNGDLHEEDAYRLWAWYVLDGLRGEAVNEAIQADFQWVTALRRRFIRLAREHAERRKLS